MKKIVIICLMFPVLVMAQHGKRDARNQKNTAAELFPCSIEQASLQGPLPRNVIFVVGDGMGTAQVYSSVVAQGDNSVFLQFPYSGFSRTYSRNRYTSSDDPPANRAPAWAQTANNDAVFLRIIS